MYLIKGQQIQHPVLTKQTDGSYEYVIDDIDSVVKAMTEQGVMDLGYGYIGDRDSLIDTYTGGLNVFL